MSSTLLTFCGEYDSMQKSEIKKGRAMPAPDTPNNKFANFIRRRMKEVQVEQRDLVAKFSIPQATVSRWLKGVIGDPPSLPVFVMFSEALQTPLWQLLEQAGYKVERPTDPDFSERQMARQIEATPELRPIVQWLFDLDLNDRAAVMTFVEILQRRRAEQDQTLS